MTNNDALLTPYALNKNLMLKNKIVMAPMTRDMAHHDLTPTPQMAEYYARRADAGLIITEGTVIHESTIGYKNVPGIFTPQQISGWQKVTDAVHQRDGHIFLQIWHLGRTAHPHYLKGELPIGASDTEMTGRVWGSEHLQYGKSRAATVNEIQNIIAYYQQAAKNAISAGFDGVEIHGANGYLLDQFLHYDTNHRTDNYGGSPENMARLPLEIINAVGEAIGYEKVGIRLSPAAYLNQIKADARDEQVFAHLLEKLNDFPMAYVHTGNFDDATIFSELSHQTMTEFMRVHYRGTLIACGSYDFQDAAAQITADKFDLIAIGRPFIANPDLIARLESGQEIKAYDDSMLDILY